MSIVSDASALINLARIGKQRYTFERFNVQTFKRTWEALHASAFHVLTFQRSTYKR